LLQPQTSTEAYWTENFSVTQSDLEFLYNLFLEEETPIRTPELIQRLIEFRISSESKAWKKLWEKGEFYQPSKAYKVGQELIFPAYSFAKGKVVGERAGVNPEHGAFTVLEVAFEDGMNREVASQLITAHQLNEEIAISQNGDDPDPEAIYNRYKRKLTPIVVDALREDQDTLFIAKRWFLKSLLLDVNIAHLNLAEAVLDIADGGPVDTHQIAAEVGFGEDVNSILQRVSLDYGLSLDERFDEVGPAGMVMWYLKRMEPTEINEPPVILRYNEVPYDTDALTDDMLDLEELLDDELSIHELVDEDDLDDDATITLTYPHWRLGTFPLTQRAEHLFPIAYRTPRIRISLIDAHTKEEVSGWVVRDYGFVFGLGDFYQRHSLPIGAYIRVYPDENDPTRIFVDFDGYKPRSEWLWVAHAADNRLHFSEGQQLIGASFDDLMTLGVDDTDALDALGTKYRNQRRELSAIMVDLIRELAQFSPQGHVHSKTLYSAVNMLRRCPPGPIFSTLRKQPEFIHAGGPYWRLA
jgi:hypothetical protein